MFCVVMGGSGSGKSEYAEQLIVDLGKRRRIYIATMVPWDDECREKIRHHQSMRRTKGFSTIECYRDLSGLIIEDVVAQQQMNEPGDTAILVECMSNWAANEYFNRPTENTEENWGVHTVAAIMGGIDNLRRQSDDLVVVTNLVFSDCVQYSQETIEYMKILGEVNRQIVQTADRAVEVVYSIPVEIKKKG